MKGTDLVTDFDAALSEQTRKLAVKGKIEYFDMNGDGRPDLAVVTHPDGRTERWVDVNYDGKWDTWVEDTDGDGKFDRGKSDANKDGKFDNEWRDANGDGKAQADELRPIDPPEPINGPPIDTF